MPNTNNVITTAEQLPLVLTVDMVCNIMGISRAKAYELSHSQNFPVIRVGRRIAIPRDNFLRWLDETARNNG